MHDWFVVKDIDSFINATRIMIFVNFGNTNKSKDIEILSIEDLSHQDQDELNKVLSFNESLLIAKDHMKKQKNKHSKDIRYIISEKNYSKLVTDLHSRMMSNLITQLVNKGLIETAFDDEANDFIFWVKEKNDQKENPETD